MGVPERPCVPEAYHDYSRLNQAVVDEVAAIDDDLRRRVYGNFQTRLQQCIDVNGGHLPDVHKISL